MSKQVKKQNREKELHQNAQAYHGITQTHTPTHTRCCFARRLFFFMFVYSLLLFLLLWFWLQAQSQRKLFILIIIIVALSSIRLESLVVEQKAGEKYTNHSTLIHCLWRMWWEITFSFIYITRKLQRIHQHFPTHKKTVEIMWDCWDGGSQMSPCMARKQHYLYIVQSDSNYGKYSK